MGADDLGESTPVLPHRRGPRARGVGPGSLPWLLLPFRGDTAGRTPIQPDGLRHPRHKMMNIGPNSTGSR